MGISSSWARDSDAAYYGLATLEQMLDQSEAGTLKISTFEDYAFQKYRGAVEGYYGYPWSVEGTLSWFDFAKRYKMNIFLYGPKTDPYHLGQWDEDYPTEVTEGGSGNRHPHPGRNAPVCGEGRPVQRGLCVGGPPCHEEAH